MSLDKTNIKVLNFSRSFICVPCKDRNVGIDGSEDGIEPNFDFFTMQELDYINAHCPLVFRTGMLEFEEEYRDEIYAALRIPDWRERCIFERDIDEMITNPTLESMKKIVGIKDIQTIERIRGHMVVLIARGAGVGINLQKVVDKRFNEISNGVIKTSIEVEQAQQPSQVVNQEVEALKAQMAEQMAQMAAMRELLLAKEATVATPVVEKPIEKPVEPVIEKAEPSVTSVEKTPDKAPQKLTSTTTKATAKKPAGRPPKKK